MLLALCLLAADLRAADPAVLKEADQLYLHRNEAGKLDASIAALKSAPKDAAVLWRVGRGLIAAGGRREKKEDKLALYKEAESALNEAVSLAPNDSSAHYWLAREMGAANSLLRTLGLARSMKKELEKSLELDQENAAAHQTYGELLHQLPWAFGGNKKKAIHELEEALRLSPNETGRYQALAEGYLDAGRKDDAVKTLNRVFEIKAPDDPGSFEDDLQDARQLLKRLGSNP